MAKQVSEKVEVKGKVTKKPISTKPIDKAPEPKAVKQLSTVQKLKASQSRAKGKKGA